MNPCRHLIFVVFRGMPIEVERREFLRTRQRLRNHCSLMLTIFALLCDNKQQSAICQRKFRTALMLNYLCGLTSYNDAKHLNCFCGCFTSHLTETDFGFQS